MLQIKCISFVSLEIFIPYFFRIQQGLWNSFGASMRFFLALVEMSVCMWWNVVFVEIQMDARHSKFIRKIKFEREKNTISYTMSVGCTNFVENSVCISMWPCICVICFIIWVMYTYYFALFFLVKYFTALSHWVMCYFKHVVNYSTILSLTSLVHVNCNLYFFRPIFICEFWNAYIYYDGPLFFYIFMCQYQFWVRLLMFLQFQI